MIGMKKNLPAVRTAQSPEITDALQQYTRYIGKCWERTIAILRNEALDRGYRFGKRCKGGLFLRRVCDSEFLRRIDPVHPQRALKALQHIAENPVVIKSPTYMAVSFIPSLIENGNGEYLMELGNEVIRHYLSDELSIEYDSDLVMSFSTASAAILYKKACMIANGVVGYFDMTEEDIRLTFSVDTFKDNLKDSKIKELSQLKIKRSSAYKRFDHLISRVIIPGIAEINKAHEDGRCPFSLSPEIHSASSNKKKPNMVRFFIEDPKDDENDDDEDTEIEDADIIEVVEDAESQPHQKAVEGVQMEIPFTSESLSADDKLSEIEGQITEIFRVSEATHIGTYPQCITNQIRERLQTQVNLPDAVGAWIEYCKNFIIKNNQGDEKYIETKQGAKEVARLLQSSLEIHNHLVYESARKKGRKDHLKWNGKDRVMFPWDIDPNFYSNNSQNINSNGQSDNDQAAGSQLNSASAAAFGIWGQRKWNPPVV